MPLEYRHFAASVQNYCPALNTWGFHANFFNYNPGCGQPINLYWHAILMHVKEALLKCVAFHQVLPCF